jgi:hypothetical protein
VRNGRSLAAGLCIAVALVPALSGCSPPQTTMSAKEVSEFKGGPMPESARRYVAEQMRLAQQRQQAKNLRRR